MRRRSKGAVLDQLPVDFDEADYLRAHPDVAAAVAAGAFASGGAHYLAHGRAEGRSLHPQPTRHQRIVAGLDLTRPGLEIGPCHSPIAPKREGYDVEIVDYVDTDRLRAHYAPQRAAGLDLDAIEDVDHVWRGESLAELVGRRGEIHWVIASHVIEHIPDPIRFLQGVGELLAPDGRLSLAVPDKRYCFDHFAPLTYAGHWIDAFDERRSAPTPGQAFEYFARCARAGDQIAWSSGFDAAVTYAHSLEEASQALASSRGGEDFAGEIHLWRFTPESFRLLIAELGEVGLIDLQIVDEAPTNGSEFYVSLGHGHGRAPLTESHRLDLQRAARLSDPRD